MIDYVWHPEEYSVGFGFSPEYGSVWFSFGLLSFTVDF